MKANSDTKGGIDLNPDLLELKTKGGGIEFQLPENLKYLETTPINGLTPLIIEIVPVTNLPLLLGVSDKEQKQELSLTAS